MVIAGMNGAGKSTCYRQFLKEVLAGRIDAHIDPDEIEKSVRKDLADAPLSDREFSKRAQQEGNLQRWMHLDSQINFSFETVFSDPVGDKVAFIEEARKRGYVVVLLAVGLCSPEKSGKRVALRVSRGGHPVPPELIIERYPRVLQNFTKGVAVASLALVVDNSEDQVEDDGSAYYAFAIYADGELVESGDVPAWWQQTCS
jgi:predicted ABC-type ATPase